MPQGCRIYLCATKKDLIDEDRTLRQIDYHDAQDFAEGNWSPTFQILLIWQHHSDHFFISNADIGAEHVETSSKTGNNVGESRLWSHCNWFKNTFINVLRWMNQPDTNHLLLRWVVPESSRGLQGLRLPAHDRWLPKVQFHTRLFICNKESNTLWVIFVSVQNEAILASSCFRLILSYFSVMIRSKSVKVHVSDLKLTIYWWTMNQFQNRSVFFC